MPEMPVCPDCHHRHKDYKHVCGHSEKLHVEEGSWGPVAETCICPTRQEAGG